MKKIFRKNQIIITALALMIAVAGYISYTRANVAENDAIQTAGETNDISDGEQIGEIFTDTEDNTQTASAADAQAEDGGYEAYGDKSSESVSQVILALSTYGIDCNKDARFRKKEKGLYDNLMEYYKKDGSFSHLLDGDSDPMATDQAFCAMAAYSRYLNGKTSFYDMSDTN